MFEHRPLVFSVASALSDSVALPVTSDSGFTPAALFRRGEEGFYNDITTYSSTYFEDTAGTDTAELEDTIALVLDQSQGLELGPELVTNGDFSTSDLSGWSGTAGSLTVVSGELEATSGSSGLLRGYAFTTEIGKFYRLTGVGRLGTFASTVQFGINNSLSTPTFKNDITSTNSQDVNIFFAASATTTYVVLRFTAIDEGKTAYFDNISVRELPGNHLTQATAGARPKLSARYNLLTYSEQFDNAAWAKNINVTVTANAITAPNGTLTADKLISGASTNNQNVYRAYGVTRAVVFSFYAKAGEYNYAAFDGGSGVGTKYFDLVNGTSSAGTSISFITDGWYRCSVSLVPVSVNFGIGMSDNGARTSFTGDGTSGIYIWGADLRLASDTDQPAYQRVTTATDYDSTGFDPYLQFDLVDDALTATIPAITGGTLVLATRDGIWIDDDINASAGTFSIGPTTYTGGPAGLLSVIGNKLIGPPLLLDRQLTASEKNAVIQWFQSRGAGALYVLGEELVTNGTFDTDTTGWTTVDATISVVSGELEVNSSGSVGRGVQATAVSIGSVYQVKGSFRNGTANADFRVGNTSGGSQYARKVNTGTLDQLFAATTTLTYLSCLNTLGTAYYDNISIRQLTQPGA